MHLAILQWFEFSSTVCNISNMANSSFIFTATYMELAILQRFVSRPNLSTDTYGEDRECNNFWVWPLSSYTILQ